VNHTKVKQEVSKLKWNMKRYAQSFLVSLVLLGCLPQAYHSTMGSLLVAIGRSGIAYQPYNAVLEGLNRFTLLMSCSRTCELMTTSCHGFNFFQNDTTGTFVCQLFQLDPLALLPAINQTGSVVWLKIQDKHENGEDSNPEFH
jgi:hypothetical protein